MIFDTSPGRAFNSQMADEQLGKFLRMPKFSRTGGLGVLYAVGRGQHGCSSLSVTPLSGRAGPEVLRPAITGGLPFHRERKQSRVS